MSPESHINSQTDGQPQPERLNEVVTFLGRVMQEQPEIMEELSPTDAYIVFSYSDPTNGRSFKELQGILGVYAIGIYRNRMEKIYKKASPEIQQDIPLETIFEESATAAHKRARRAQGIDSFETRRRRSESLKKRWQDPEYRESQVEAVRKASAPRRGTTQSAETIAARAETMRHIWQNPEYRTHMLRKRRSKRGIKFSDETRAKMSEAQRIAMSDPRRREITRESSKRMWSDPDFRRRMSEVQSRRVNDPVYRARMAELWESPDFKERMGELSRTVWQSYDEEGRTARIRAIKLGKDSDYQLWKYALENGVVTVILEQGFMTETEIDMLESVFYGGNRGKVQSVLNKFSKLVASLAE